MRELLSARGVAFEERDVSADRGALRDMVRRYHSRTTPTVVVVEEVVIGFDPRRLEELLNALESH